MATMPDDSVKVPQLLGKYAASRAALYFDKVALGELPCKLKSFGEDLERYGDWLPSVGNKFERKVRPAHPLFWSPLSEIAPEPHTQKMFSGLAAKY